MSNPVPVKPKLYHILHVDRLPSVFSSGYLWCDAKTTKLENAGTKIGINRIKARRLNELSLSCYPDLYVGQCVPFYFCPRSVMLYMIHKGNHPELPYPGGQTSIVHLESDLYDVVKWADSKGKRWAFTLSNAAERSAEYRNDLNLLGDINWPAVTANDWKKERGAKQSEFLLEKHFPIQLIETIGVFSNEVAEVVKKNLDSQQHKPLVSLKTDWYY